MVFMACARMDFLPPQVGSSWGFCSVECCECRSAESEDVEVGGTSQVI